MTTIQTGAAPTRGRRLALIFKALFRDPATAIGALVMIAFVFFAAFGPLLAPYGFNESIYQDARQAPSAAHWFGTDHLARDVFSRVVYGARSVFVLAGAGTLVAVLLGTVLGLLTGYIGGWFDELWMRFFDSLLSLPALLLALLILGMLRSSFGDAVSSISKGLGVLIVLIVVYTPIVTRVVRSVVLSVKTRGYIEAARVQGESTRRILFREMLPSVLPALAVEAALRFSYAIFLTSSLGFLGVGVQPPNPDWGLMVSEARGNYFQVPWSLWFPVGAISIIVIGANLLADGIKRILQTGMEA
jgi:peptide/nickel transport system permease protein